MALAGGSCQEMEPRPFLPPARGALTPGGGPNGRTAGDASPEGGGPPSRVRSAVGQGGAVGRPRFVDPAREPGRDEGDDDGDEIDASLVADDVRVLAVVDEA